MSLLGTASAPLSAQLKYTLRMEVHKTTVQSAADPMMVMMGNVLLETVVPDGSVELTCALGDKGIRVEWNKALAGIPAGAVLLRLADGTTVLLDPTTKTYWKLTVFDLASLPPSWRAEVKRQPSGEFETLAGVRAERASLQVRIPFALAASGETVSGTPTELNLSGEVWTTDRYKQYLTPGLRPIMGLAVIGLETVGEGGFVLRQVLHGAMLGDSELESRVTSLSEEALPESLFAIPPGYKEVPAP